MVGPDLPHLGIVASKRLRRNNPAYPRPQGQQANDRTIDQFVDDHLEVLKNYHLVVTRGTYTDAFADPSMQKSLQTIGGSQPIAWNPKFQGLSGEVLRRGKDGGLVELSARLVTPRAQPTRPQCDAIIFLMDPEDYEEQFPENRQLIRMASVENAILLLNYRSASLWANHESPFGPKYGAGTHHLSDGEVVALIAHNEKKIPMCKFVVKYHSKLMRFKGIVTTGTTGMYVLDFLKLFDPTFSNLNRQNSGPSGGDAEISQLILDGNCQHVCFFIDPMTAHPHEADVFALLRACTFDGCEVNLRLTPNAAQSWIDSV